MSRRSGTRPARTPRSERGGRRRRSGEESLRPDCYGRWNPLADSKGDDSVKTARRQYQRNEGKYAEHQHIGTKEVALTQPHGGVNICQ
jgi:hypothetical protein